MCHEGIIATVLSCGFQGKGVRDRCLGGGEMPKTQLGSVGRTRHLRSPCLEQLLCRMSWRVTREED